VSEPSPEDAAGWLARGRALAAEGRGREADEAFERYFALAPGRRRVAEGVEAQTRGELETAAAHYRAALEEDPSNVDAMRLLGVALSLLGRADEALRHARRAVALAPEYLSAWSNLGAVLSELDRPEEAADVFRRAVELDPNAALSHYNLGNALSTQGDHAGAEAAFRAALVIDPDHPASLLGLGHVLKTIGRRNGALVAYRASLAAKPDLGEAWWSLANLKTHRFSDDDRAAMEALLARDALGKTSRIAALFALGKAFEDAKDYAAAFERYAEGAALQREKVRYDPVETEKINERIMSVFTKAFFAAHDGEGCDDPAPIFIVGLPRSGSTLIEQILASHSGVDGTAELPAMAKLTQEIGRFRSDGVRFPEALRELEPHDLEALGRAYIARTKRFRGSRPRFTDKMPNNFALTGLIKLILPNAKVIDARRHPLDSCMGSFKQLFARGQTFTYDLFEIGHYYIQYDRMMAHWNDVLPGFVHRVDYEAMVLNQEEETRKLLAFCGLEFEEQCLDFHKTERAVNTASSEQVRKPIYRDSLQGWRRFESELGGLKAQLQPLLDELPPVVANSPD